MLVSAVVHAVRKHLEGREQHEHDQTAHNREMEQAGLGHRLTSFAELEADVLQGFGCVPVETGRERIVPPSACEVALSDPGARAVAG
jgi:hypothetical protein